MFYREAGNFKQSYAEDQAVFPVPVDRWAIGLYLVIAFVGIPIFGSDYFIGNLMIPFLIFTIAALGLNVLLGYAGQLSLGTGAFMALGAFMAYKMVTFAPTLEIFLQKVFGLSVSLPDLIIPINLGFTAFDFQPLDFWFVIILILSGLITAAVGFLFGLPSLKIKGFYLAVTTLAAQFFLLWLFNAVPWFVNGNVTGVPATPDQTFLGILSTGSEATNTAKYLFVLTLTVVSAFFVKNLVRGHIGRTWMAMRDMDIAAELIGIRPFWAKLSAFVISSFLIGIAGALWAFVQIDSVQVEAYEIEVSFRVLFMVILGGLGTVIGCFFGAAFVWVLPIALNLVLSELGFGAATVRHAEFVMFGALIIFFLIMEPHGLARLWQIAKEKLRIWPFPYA